MKVQTVRDLLTSEPVGERLDSAQDHYLEFISYLRPVMKGNMNTEQSGWSFLTKHVASGSPLFKDIVRERRRQEAIIKAHDEGMK